MRSFLKWALKRFYRNLFATILLTSIISTKAHSDDHVKNDFQLWTPIVLNLDGPDHFKAYLETTPRLKDNWQDIKDLILRAAVGYQATEYLSLWNGYVFQPSFTPHLNHNEQDIFQQISYDAPLKRIILTNRLRLDERFFNFKEGTVIRPQYLLRVTYPFGKDKKWALLLSDELFVNLNSLKNGPHHGVEENRLYAGIGREFNKHVWLESGYLLQFIRINSPAPEQLNHALVFNVTFRL